MRLLNIHTLEFREFYSQLPAYAITSHRWQDAQECTYYDIRDKMNTEKEGYKKVLKFCDVVKDINARGRLRTCPDIQWIWIDTCCINKQDLVELSEAINSMWRWYRNSTICLAFLYDVDGKTSKEINQSLQKSVWFTRGWTLQELLAPRYVVLLNKHWRAIGHKRGGGTDLFIKSTLGPTWNDALARITGVPSSVLADFSQANKMSVVAKQKWMSKRTTTRREDKAYCQLGIFGIFMPLIYGEGENAMVRLKEEIEKKLLPVSQRPQSMIVANPEVKRKQLHVRSQRGAWYAGLVGGLHLEYDMEIASNETFAEVKARIGKRHRARWKHSGQLKYSFGIPGWEDEHLLESYWGQLKSVEAWDW